MVLASIAEQVSWIYKTTITFVETIAAFLSMDDPGSIWSFSLGGKGC